MDAWEFKEICRFWAIHAPRQLGSSEAEEDLVVATKLLRRYVREDQIPVVIRRPVERLGGQSLLDLAHDGRFAEVRAAVEAAFDLRGVQP